MVGKFITFEGPEGSGKTTQLKRLYDVLHRKGFDVVRYREPGGTILGEKIRQVILNNDMCPMTELLLFYASRAQLTQQIRQDLAKGNIVLCDRYADSTIAYQVYGRFDSGSDSQKPYLDLISAFHKFPEIYLKPDLTFLLDLPVEEGLARRMANKGTVNRLDKEELSFHERVREAYLGLAEIFPDRIVAIDASNDLEQVYRDVEGQVIQL